jgi:hypothetical protein
MYQNVGLRAGPNAQSLNMLTASSRRRPLFFELAPPGHAGGGDSLIWDKLPLLDLLA